MFKAERPGLARKPRCIVEAYLRRFQQKSAAAAHRIQQWRARLPAGKTQNAGGEVFLERRPDLGQLVTAHVERLAGGVEIQRGLLVGDEEMNANLGASGIDAGASPGLGPEAVTDGILDA